MYFAAGQNSELDLSSDIVLLLSYQCVCRALKIRSLQQDQTLSWAAALTSYNLISPYPVIIVISLCLQSSQNVHFAAGTNSELGCSSLCSRTKLSAGLSSLQSDQTLSWAAALSAAGPNSELGCSSLQSDQTLSWAELSAVGPNSVLG